MSCSSRGGVEATGIGPIDDLDERRDVFARELAACQRRLYAYIVSLIPNRDDADEVFQETNVRMWQRFSEFELGTDFSALAMRVAYFQVLAWRKKAARGRLVFSDTLLDLVAQQHEELLAFADTRHQALADCVKHLPEHSQDILSKHYGSELTIREIAEGTGRTSQSLYKALQRVRVALRECIERKMKILTEE